jgi:glycosyltransferase involved in cell wall biosynthesis
MRHGEPRYMNAADRSVSTICLTMIVKNESKTILRLLESLDGFIDEFCTCDTGSTDDTVEIIRTYAKSKISKDIMREQFRTGYNNVVLNFANLNSRSEYFAVDGRRHGYDVSREGREEAKAALMTTGGDAFNIMQGTGRSTIEYADHTGTSRTGIIRTGDDAREYKTADISKHTVDKSVLFIHDIGDGGQDR